MVQTTAQSFVLFNKTSIKNNCLIALLAINPESLNTIKQYITKSKQHQTYQTELAIDHEISRGMVW